MRTTVQLRDDQREALAAIASRRHLRGYSELIQEAVDRYLVDENGNENDAFLALQGTISDEEAKEMREAIAEARANWRWPSS